MVRRGAAPPTGGRRCGWLAPCAAALPSGAVAARARPARGGSSRRECHRSFGARLQRCDAALELHGHAVRLRASRTAGARTARRGNDCLANDPPQDDMTSRSPRGRPAPRRHRELREATRDSYGCEGRASRRRRTSKPGGLRVPRGLGGVPTVPPDGLHHRDSGLWRPKRPRVARDPTPPLGDPDSWRA